MHDPVTRMRRLRLAWVIRDGTVAAMVANVWRWSACVPIEEEARPAMMMHRLGLAGRGHRYHQHSHDGIFKDDSMAVGRGLHGVVSVGESGFVLAVEIETARENHKGDREYAGRDSRNS